MVMRPPCVLAPRIRLYLVPWVVSGCAFLRSIKDIAATSNGVHDDKWRQQTGSAQILSTFVRCGLAARGGAVGGRAQARASGRRMCERRERERERARARESEGGRERARRACARIILSPPAHRGRRRSRGGAQPRRAWGADIRIKEIHRHKTAQQPLQHRHVSYGA